MMSGCHVSSRGGPGGERHQTVGAAVVPPPAIAPAIHPHTERCEQTQELGKGILQWSICTPVARYSGGAIFCSPEKLEPLDTVTQLELTAL